MNSIIPVTKEFRILVDYSPVEKIITGKYDLIDKKINAENFFWKQTGIGEIFFKIFGLASLGRYITDEEIAADLMVFDYQLPLLPEQVAIAETCPVLQKQFSLIALNQKAESSTASFIDKEEAVHLITYPLKYYYNPEKHGFIGVKRILL